MALSLDTILKLPMPQKLGIVIGCALLLVGGYWLGPYRNIMKRIQAKESRLADITREVNNKKTIVKDWDKFKEELAKMNEDLQTVVAKLPDQKEIPKLLKSITNMSREAGLDVLLFKPQGEQPGQYYSRVPVELKFIGSYHQIGRFFYYVATLDRIVNIESFSIKDAQIKGSEEILLNTSCTATTYRYLEKTKQ